MTTSTVSLTSSLVHLGHTTMESTVLDNAVEHIA
jgi:hypothetical protein